MNSACGLLLGNPLEKLRMPLERRIPNFDRHLESGKVVILGREIYLKGDHVDHLGLMSDLINMFSSALAKGLKGMRASGDGLHWSLVPLYYRHLTVNDNPKA